MSRRHFLALTTVAAGATTLAGCATFQRDPANALAAERCSLDGAWEVAPVDKDDWLPATVPGCVHTDLLAAGRIPDPFYRDNEASLQWIGQSDWRYRRTFQVPAGVRQRDRVLLRCEGLDTLATLKLNGHVLGSTDNMFRGWEFDVKPLLTDGANEIEITFASPYPVMARRNAEQPLYEWIGSHEPKGRAWVRKEPCSFGWDWGAVLPSCGIWRPIEILGYDEGRLHSFLALQDHSQPGRVGLEVAVEAELVRPVSASARVTLQHAGRLVAKATIPCPGGQGRAALEIKNPQLWWPAGMGRQPLYEVTVELLNPDGQVLGRMTKRIGLRRLELLPPEGALPLRFAVNGVPFFAKGANLIPTDVFVTRVTPERLRRYVADAVAVNMNSLRFWGGGYYEEDALFDACDELGVCVWLDFKFACSAYPAFDDAFLANVRQEARDNLLRLRHHACIAVWCGNNEIGLMTKEKWSDQSMGQADYDKLFKDLLGAEVKALAPQANYVSGSPDCGDVHFWKVWHGGEQFEIYRTLDGFMSEFGFQSFPHPRTIRAFTTEADRVTVLSPVMKWHQRSNNDGNEKIVAMIPNYFKAPKDFESTVWLSQILQGYGIKMGAEHWRQSMPKSMGCVYWQYNDCWPVVSWSSVDYFGRWKALHFLARRFYAPLLVSGLEHPADASIEIFVTSDQLTDTRGQLVWEVTDPQGTVLLRDALPLDIPARTSRRVHVLSLDREAQRHGPANLLTWLRLEVGGRVVSENLVLLARPKEVALPDPKLSFTVQAAGAEHHVTLRSEHPALWAWLDVEDVDAAFSDNFLHVRPDRPVTVVVRPQHPLDRAGLVRALRIRSLFDLSA